MFYSDVGNSLLAVDEATSFEQFLGGNSGHPCIQVSLINMPSTGLVVASIALSTAPLQKESAEDRQATHRNAMHPWKSLKQCSSLVQVVLLHRPMEEQKISPRPPGLFEGTLETISADAVPCLDIAPC